jgi:hypothetical protein
VESVTIDFGIKPIGTMVKDDAAFKIPGFMDLGDEDAVDHP